MVLGSCSKSDNEIDQTQIIQPVTVVPAYNDGSVMAINNLLEVNCIVSPASVLTNIGTDLKGGVKLYSSVVTTKALPSGEIEVRNKEKSKENKRIC